MTKILFVCHGNICRSPMAEFIFKKLLSTSNLQDDFYVVSAATSSEEIYLGKGNPVYPPAKAELSKHGISCSGKTAVQITKSDYQKYDYIIGMDSANIRNMLAVFGNDSQNKICKLLEFTGSSRDVSDPWYSGDFQQAYNDIESGCKALFKKLTQNE